MTGMGVLSDVKKYSKGQRSGNISVGKTKFLIAKGKRKKGKLSGKK